MKKCLIITAIALSPFMADAQNINFSNGAVTYSFPAEVAGEMTFAGTTVTVAGRSFNLPEWSQMRVTETAIEANTVAIAYDGDNATVTIAGNIAQYVDVEVNGAHVSVT